MIEYIKPRADIVTFLASQNLATTTEEDDNVIKLPGEANDLSFGESVEDGWN